jgi:hypothetical protein
MKKLFFVLLLGIHTCFFSLAQVNNPNQIFDSRARSVQIMKNGTEDRYPIIGLEGEQLKLSFDMLGAEAENYQYTLIHCDADWNVSKFNQFEYIKGMQFDNIVDFKFSTNTYVKYVHYNLIFPNENLKPTWSGNYILKVFRNFDENDLLFVRRVLIIKRSAEIEATAKPATLAEYRYTRQEVQFSVGFNPSQIVNPLQDVKVVLLQNHRWENALFGLTPLFASNNKLDYSYVDKTLFNGGNEFRFFDTRNLRQFSQNVRSKRTDSVWHVLLNIDESRASNQYFQYADYNGKQLIFNKEGNNSELDGDYAYTTFFLSGLSGVPSDKDVYVIGEFTDWRCLPEYKMYYNRNRQRYDLEIPLKQGRYEYAYAVKDESGKPDDVSIEGSHFQTENEYLILVYTRNLQYNYDELIGARRINSVSP